MASYIDVSKDITIVKNAVLNLSSKVSLFKKGEEVRHEFGKIQAIIKKIEGLLLEG